jgi:hypothetical protein
MIDGSMDNTLAKLDPKERKTLIAAIEFDPLRGGIMSTRPHDVPFSAPLTPPVILPSKRTRAHPRSS